MKYLRNLEQSLFGSEGPFLESQVSLSFVFWIPQGSLVSLLFLFWNPQCSFAFVSKKGDPFLKNGTEYPQGFPAKNNTNPWDSEKFLTWNRMGQTPKHGLHLTKLIHKSLHASSMHVKASSFMNQHSFLGTPLRRARLSAGQLGIERESNNLPSEGFPERKGKSRQRSKSMSIIFCCHSSQG